MGSALKRFLSGIYQGLSTGFSLTGGTTPKTLTVTANVTLGGWSVVTSATTATTGCGYLCDTQTTAAFTLTLPASPSLGDEVAFADLRGYFATNNLTIGRNSEKIMGLSEDMTVSTNNACGRLVYSGSTYGWRLV